MRRKWLRRVRRATLLPPPGPDPGAIEEARQVARDAERTLQEVLGRDSEVSRQADRARRIHQRNNLGPSFWAAVEGRQA